MSHYNQAPRSNRRLVIGLLGFTAAAVSFGPAIFKNHAGVYKDDRDKINVDTGIFSSGECAGVTGSVDNHSIATFELVQPVVQQLVKKCGACLDTPIYAEGLDQSFQACPDPTTLEVKYNSEGTWDVITYLTTEPAGGPPGLIYNTFTDNKGICKSWVNEIRSDMTTYFGLTFSPTIADRLRPVIGIAPGSESPCNDPLPA